MATKFYLPDGTVTDLIAITLPAFFARTPEEFLAFAAAQVRRTRRPASPISPSSRRSRPSHPNAGRVLQLLLHQPALVSFAQVSYRPFIPSGS